MQHSPNKPNDLTNLPALKALVDAEAIGSTVNVTGRYILKLADEDKIPCLRLGKKCVRFDPQAVAEALQRLHESNLAAKAQRNRLG